jgi:hypothetical protein
MRKSLWIIPVLLAAIVVPYAKADSISDTTTITTQADPKIPHPYIYVRLPHMTRCPYLYAYAASRS